MASIPIHTRKYQRAAVTKLYKQRGTLYSIDAVRGPSVNLKVDKLSSDLMILDKQIIELEFSDDYEENYLIRELESSEHYK